MSEWTPGTLSSVIESLDAGVSVNAEDRPHGSGEVGVLKTSALSGGVFRPQENKAVLPRERRLVAEPVQGDSILVSRMNTPALVGESCYVAEPHPTLYLPDRIWQLKPKKQAQVQMRWLSSVLRSEEFRRYVEVHATGTSGSMKNLPKSRLLSLPINYPKIGEQQRIAEVLDVLDTIIGETELLIVKLKSSRQGLLNDLLTRGIDANGELRPPKNEMPNLYKDSSLGWIPKDWACKSFGDLCESSAFGPRFPSDAYNDNGPLAMLRTTDMDEDGNISLSTMPRAAIAPSVFSEHLLRPGDIVISRSGTCGVTGIFAGHDIPVVPGAFLIRFRLRDLRLNRFYRRLFNSFLGRPHLERLAVGGVQKNIKGSDVLRLQVPIPEPREAVEIAERIDLVERDIEGNRQLLTKLQLQKSGLMDDLLTGRVRVTPLLNPQAAA